MKIQTKLNLTKTKTAVKNEVKGINDKTKQKISALVTIKLPERSIVYFQNTNPDIYMQKYLKRSQYTLKN
jgi:hypothetical protein